MVEVVEVETVQEVLVKPDVDMLELKLVEEPVPVEELELKTEVEWID